MHFRPACLLFHFALHVPYHKRCSSRFRDKGFLYVHLRPVPTSLEMESTPGRDYGFLYYDAVWTGSLYKNRYKHIAEVTKKRLTQVTAAARTSCQSKIFM